MGKIRVPDSYVLSSDRNYFFWTDKPYSKYCGLYFNINGEMIKCLEKIDTKTSLFKSKFFKKSIENERSELKETYSFENEILSCRFSKKHEIEIDLDIRKINDFSEWGRTYQIYQEKEIIIIEYQKEMDYGYYVAIKTEGSFEIINQFEKRDYTYDKRRQAEHTRYINKILKLHASYLAITMSSSKKEVIQKIKNLKFTENEPIINQPANALDKLISSEGIAAGYPWFYQIWSRDEMISLGYLIREKRFDEVKNILSKYFKEDYYEKMPAILPFQGNESADGNGWFFLRFYEFIVQLQKEKLLKKYYSNKELHNMVVHLEIIIASMHEKMNDWLVYSDKNETWMDTSHNDEGRSGYCIEIQALALRMYRVLYELTDREEYKQLEEQMKKRVIEKFLDKNLLYDYLDKELKPNKTIRPNIFIAYYVYPWLLDKNTWELIFDRALKSLWLKWGGLSSLDIKDRLFLDEYTGEGNESYHRGDSWYYLNCMAAICMNKVNPKKYGPKIMKIKMACQEDMNEGVVGSIAEVSSAKERSSLGCLSQAWSLAMYLELISKLK